MTPLVALVCIALANTFNRSSSRRGASIAIASLPPLKSSDGSAVSRDALADRLRGKRVALYFAAGWCPMSTSFEPSLFRFREEAGRSGKDVEIVYVPSDRSEADATWRAEAMGMLAVPIGQEADALKRRFKIWAGSESEKLGTERRSGVPALVVLDSIGGDEMAFLPVESEGAKALSSWPLDNNAGLW